MSRIDWISLRMPQPFGSVAHTRGMVAATRIGFQADIGRLNRLAVGQRNPGNVVFQNGVNPSRSNSERRGGANASTTASSMPRNSAALR